MLISQLTTEKRNDKTTNIDEIPIVSALELMNNEDQNVARVIKNQLKFIGSAIEKVVDSFQGGGRLIYVGAGTSGRLGVLDASECVPTFGVSSEMVKGIIAGGKEALTIPSEKSEDDEKLGINDLKMIEINANDTVVGITASGRTPYVLGALKYASEIGCSTVSISCNDDSEVSKLVEVPIEVEVGPEVITGSTRLKAGTAQKLVLNMISTVSMIRIGKVYQNLMVDVSPTNMKLKERSKEIIMAATDIDYVAAERYFKHSGEQVKVAIVMVLLNCSRKKAEQELNSSNGVIKDIINT